MTAHISSFSRSLKADIAREIYRNLTDRQQAGPPEPGLDVFIAQVGDVADRLETHVQGKLEAHATRTAQQAQAETADVQVDTHYRHIDSFVFVEANRRSGPHVEAAAALYKTACPKGLAYVDARIPEQNAYCRSLLSALRAEEHAETLKAIRFPMEWLDLFDAALTDSETAFNEAAKARGEQGGHVDLGRHAEEQWVDVMIRLRSYVQSRASRKDVAKKNEGQMLLRPLLDAIQKQKTDAAARATRRARAGQQASNGANGVASPLNGTPSVSPPA